MKKKKKTILTPLLVSKLVIITFLFHYKYTTHCSLFSPYLKLNTHNLCSNKKHQRCFSFFSSSFLFPWKEVCLRLISQLSENVYLFHGKTLTFFALLSLLESVVFSLVMTLVNNTKRKKSNLPYSIFNHFLLSLSKKKKNIKNPVLFFKFDVMKQPFPLFLTLSPFPLSSPSFSKF